MKIFIIVIVSFIVLYSIAEIYIRLVIDPYLKETDPDNDGVHKLKD